MYLYRSPCGAGQGMVTQNRSLRTNIYHEGLQNRANHVLLLNMKRDKERSRQAEVVRKSVAAHRAKQLAIGRVALNTYVPGDVLDTIDQIKEQRGAPSRIPIIEEALRLLIEKETEGMK